MKTRTDKLQSEVSYVKEMLLHPISTYGGLVSLSAAALLSIPFSMGVAALPLLAYVTGQSVAALFVPSLPSFRKSVDEKKRREARENKRAHLVSELKRRVGFEGQPNWSTYDRLIDRARAIAELSANGPRPLKDRDLERFEDATVNYLALWLSRLIMAERREAIEGSKIDAQLLSIDSQLEASEGANERRRLEKARADLMRVLERRDSLRAHETSVRASMVAMADAFEELHQQIYTAGDSGEVEQYVQEAADRMRLEEGLDLEVEDELNQLIRGARKQRVEQAGS